VNVRQFAKHIGVSHPAVLKAIKQGRLAGSVRRDARGRVDIEPAEGAREWDNRGRLSPAERRGERDPFSTAERVRPPAAVGNPLPGTRPPAPDVPADVSRRLVELVDEDLADVRGCVLVLVPHVLAGAIDALRDLGREPTAAEIVTALGLEPSDEDAGIDLLVAMHEIVEGDGAGSALAADLARQAGWEAAVRRLTWKAQGADDGAAS
jgi:hypothetical protein